MTAPASPSDAPACAKPQPRPAARSAEPRPRRAARLFWRNTVASVFAFALDVALLWLLVERAGWAYLTAATLGFLVAMSLHYAIARIWVFRGADRGLATGYALFLVNALIGLGVTLGLFALLVETSGLHYLVARVLASVAAGILVFALNAVFNFKAL